VNTSVPTYDQVVDLPAQTRRTVPSEFIDENGHMNIGRYLQLGGEALWSRCLGDLGMDRRYIPDRGMSTFTAEHHIQYFTEILEGREVSVRVRLLERSDKVAHAIAFIVDETEQRLSCVVETTLVHIDMTSRRPTPFPEDIAALIDLALKNDAVDWPAPVCGSMGVRRRA
jgi:acyl-CoA thioester hydrolase